MLYSLEMPGRYLAASFLLALAAVAVTACGGGEHPTMTIYLKRDLVTSGRVFHVLAPVVRSVPQDEQTPGRVLAEVLRGPTSAEAKEGFVRTLARSIEVRDVQVSGGIATVNFGGNAPRDFFAHAAVVLSLTELSGVRAVALRSNGKPCCIFDFESEPLAAPVTRVNYHGWSGEPCELRTYAGAISCRDY
jgi:spore germination protein GerM